MPAFRTTINCLSQQNYQAALKKLWLHLLFPFFPQVQTFTAIQLCTIVLKCLFYVFLLSSLRNCTYSVKRTFDFFHLSLILQSWQNIFEFLYLLYTVEVTASQRQKFQTILCLLKPPNVWFIFIVLALFVGCLVHFDILFKTILCLLKPPNIWFIIIVLALFVGCLVSFNMLSIYK